MRLEVFIIGLLCVPLLSIAQTEDFIFQSKVVDRVMAYNETGDKLVENFKRARANKSIDTISLDREIKENNRKCFQVPQDYIAEHPGSPYSLQALTMLGTGSTGSPIHVADLERLFNSLDVKVKNSPMGQAYALNLKSWPWMNSLKSSAGTSTIENSISPKQVQEGLLAVGNRKAEISSLSKYSGFVLKQNVLIGRLKAATLIVNMAYNRKEGEGIQVNPTTAYSIDESGVCVTNYHVFQEYASKDMYQSLSVMTAEGKAYPVIKVLACSESDDLVVFQVETKGGKLSALPLGDFAEKGATIQVMGHPVGSFYKFSFGVIANYSTSTLAGKPCHIMTITADFNLGSSGGPIVDGFGNVIGTVSRRNNDGSVKIGIPVSELRKLLEVKK